MLTRMDILSMYYQSYMTFLKKSVSSDLQHGICLFHKFLKSPNCGRLSCFSFSKWCGPRNLLQQLNKDCIFHTKKY